MNERTDIELIALFKGGQDEAFNELYERYKYMIKSCARSFFLVGGDSEDLMQEGVIGLLKAVNSYNGANAFSTYAYTCIKNSLLSAVKRAQSFRNKPLNYSISIYSNGFELTPTTDPEEEFIGKESADELIQKINQNLSSFEITVLKLYFEGLSYVEIATKLNKESKSIDNALQRIKRKISKILV
ncbi:MAG: sigma-70 family RNA polymerase sigma factor [Clostridia bacterium]|nr:sigma-70 family RNA polymerase sigma factor [Clostridia bacterium]